MMTHNPLIDIAVLVAFGVVFGVICYFSDKRKARKTAI